MKKAHNDMRIKANVSFMNPKTNRLMEAGEVCNVPKNQFWLRRLAEKDVEETSEMSKKKESKPVDEKKQKPKTSKTSSTKK